MKFQFILRLLACFCLACCLAYNSAAQKTPLRIGIAGLTHTHVHWIFNSAKEGDIEIVGIAESNKELAAQYARQYQFPPDKIYPTLDAMIRATKPEAVAAFNSIAEHLQVVEACAPKGIHVMVEKPLAVSLDHARKMKALADRYKIQLLTNYETTWYSSVHDAYRKIHDSASIGTIRKIVVHDGHKGPKEIGVNKEFLDWLTDPKKNGAGALTDFGCYGAVLSSWLMKGKKPASVTAVEQQIKPQVYPRVDDEATIILAYPGSQTIIQASWNWPFSRKDMEVYGTQGIVVARDRNTMSIRQEEGKTDSVFSVAEREKPYHDPFSFFRSVVRGETRMSMHDLSGLELNMMVMEILEAARQSAIQKKTILLR